jgi:hypothetical protein
MIKKAFIVAILLVAGCTPHIRTEPVRLGPNDTQQIEESIQRFGVTNHVAIVEAEKRSKGRDVWFRVVVRNADDPDSAEGFGYDLVKSNRTWIVRKQTGDVIF